MFPSKLKIAAACGAAFLILGIGFGVIGFHTFDVNHVVAVPDVNEKTKINLDNSERVRMFLDFVKNAPAQLSLLDSINEVKCVEKFSDEEIHALVPELLKLLEDQTPTPYAQSVFDAGTMEVRHRACRTLTFLAGVSFGYFPAKGGLIDVAPDSGESAQLVATWQKWWQRSQGKPRKTWLEERRPLLREQFGLLDGKGEQYSEGIEAVYVIDTINDRAALPDLLAVLKKGTATLKLNAGDSNSTSPGLMTEIVNVMGKLGDRSLVKELVPLARKVNTPEAGWSTTLLHSYEATCNKLAGTSIKALVPADLKYGDKVVKTSVLKEEAFAAWLNAVSE